VGFPGEKDSHFEHLVKFVEEMELTHVGVFSYSKEEESPSSKLKDQVPDFIKEQRKNIIMEIQRQISRKFLSRFKGRQLETIIDKKSSEWPTLYEGRVWFQAPEIDGKTYVSAEKLLEGDIVTPTIIDTFDCDLNGLV